MAGIEDKDRRAADRQAVRAARLEEALRANLKRRKEQARARGVTPSRDGTESAQIDHDNPKSGDGPAGH